MPNRELANTLFLFITSTHFNLLKQYNINMDIEINTSRDRSANASTNSSRAMSAHSSISSIPYVKRIEAQRKNPSWTNQVEEQKTNNLQRLMLSYTNSGVGDNATCNKVIDVENIPISNNESVNNMGINMCCLQSLESSFILYMENQPGKPNFWDSATLPIFLFGTDEFVMINSNNISISLLKMANFIRSRAFLVKLRKISLLLQNLDKQLGILSCSFMSYNRTT